MSYVKIITKPEKIVSIVGLSNIITITAKELTLEELSRYGGEIDFSLILNEYRDEIITNKNKNIGIYEIVVGYTTAKMLIGFIIIQKSPLLIDIVLEEIYSRKNDTGEINLQKLVSQVIARERRGNPSSVHETELNGKVIP